MLWPLVYINLNSSDVKGNISHFITYLPDATIFIQIMNRLWFRMPTNETFNYMNYTKCIDRQKHSMYLHKTCRQTETYGLGKMLEGPFHNEPLSPRRNPEMNRYPMHQPGGSLEDSAKRWNNLSVSIFIWSAICTYVFKVYGEREGLMQLANSLQQSSPDSRSAG